MAPSLIKTSSPRRGASLQGRLEMLSLGLSLGSPAPKGSVPQGLEGLGRRRVTLDGSLVVGRRSIAVPPMLQDGTGIYENRPLIRISLEAFFADLQGADHVPREPRSQNRKRVEHRRRRLRTELVLVDLE